MSEWLKATLQLMVRGGLIAVVIAVGVTAATVPTAETFDLLFTVASAKAFVAGAVLSGVFSYVSGRQGDQNKPTFG